MDQKSTDIITNLILMKTEDQTWKLVAEQRQQLVRGLIPAPQVCTLNPKNRAAMLSLNSSS